jgi:heptosyltransferase-2/heptosyltransferase-3
MHSAEQQLALLGSVGVPVDDRPKSRLVVTEKGRTARVSEWYDRGNYAMLHPGTAFFTKQWPPEYYAMTAEFLAAKGLNVLAVGSEQETPILDKVKKDANAAVSTLAGLTLPEITALASKARIFVGNDSGIAHIAAAVSTPTVVIFGSSNRDHWRPWAPSDDVPNEIVYEEFACQPCAGYECKEFGEPRCILSVQPASVIGAIERVLAAGGVN